MSDLSYYTPNDKSYMEDFQATQIIALRLEIDRLNNEIQRLSFKKYVPVVGKIDINDPVFHKPILVTNY